MTKVELETRAKYYTIKHPVEPSAVTTVESAFIAGYELCQQLLQQTPCTTLRELLVQMQSKEQQLERNTRDDLQKLKHSQNDRAIERVLLLIDARQPVA